ncbi:mCG113631, partial [Mus musculus]
GKRRRSRERRHWQRRLLQRRWRRRLLLNPGSRGDPGLGPRGPEASAPAAPKRTRTRVLSPEAKLRENV